MNEHIQIDVPRVTGIVDAWNIHKTKRNNEPTYGDMRNFVTLMNTQTRLLIAEYPNSVRFGEFWQDLARQAESASTYTTEGKFVTDIGWRSRALKMVNQFSRQEPWFYEGLMELAINAATLVTPGARIIAAGKDRTDL